MEPVRKDPSQDSPIRGIHHVSSPEVRVVLEDQLGNYHYEVTSEGGSRRFARFGDLDGFMKRRGRTLQQSRVAELIHFRQPSSLSKWYGFPRWLAAVASIELAMSQHRHLHDFFVNRGVPEFMLFVLGKKLGKKEWKLIEDAMKAQIGLGNSYKSIAINIPSSDVTVQIEKLNVEGKGDPKEFSGMSDALALEIVSAHRVPPLLAGIQIPGKLGATNELPNALKGFQALVVGPDQETFSTTLACTLGNADRNGGIALTEDDFTFRTILDEIDLDAMDTVSRMKQPLADAEKEGRDVQEGLKKEFLEDPDRAGRLVGQTFSALLLHLMERTAA
jgi:hypothetical protein